MHRLATYRRFCLGAATAILLPSLAAAQGSDKWEATISRLTIGGEAHLTVEMRNDKTSLAKITFHNTKSNIQLAWDIANGVCQGEGPPVAPSTAFTRAHTTIDGYGTVSSIVPKLVPSKSYHVRVFDPGTVATDRWAYGCADLRTNP